MARDGRRMVSQPGDLGAERVQGFFGIGIEIGFVEREQRVGDDVEAMLTTGVLALNRRDTLGNLDIARLLPWSFGLLNFAGDLPARARGSAEQHRRSKRQYRYQCRCEAVPRQLPAYVPLHHYRPPLGDTLWKISALGVSELRSFGRPFDWRRRRGKQRGDAVLVDNLPGRVGFDHLRAGGRRFGQDKIG